MFEKSLKITPKIVMNKYLTNNAYVYLVKNHL